MFRKGGSEDGLPGISGWEGYPPVAMSMWGAEYV